MPQEIGTIKTSVVSEKITSDGFIDANDAEAFKAELASIAGGAENPNYQIKLTTTVDFSNLPCVKGELKAKQSITLSKEEMKDYFYGNKRLDVSDTKVEFVVLPGNEIKSETASPDEPVKTPRDPAEQYPGVRSGRTNKADDAWGSDSSSWNNAKPAPVPDKNVGPAAQEPASKPQSNSNPGRTRKDDNFPDNDL